MNKPTVTNGDNREPKRVDIYEEFVLWSAMPPSERFKLGIETQEQFVEFYKIGTNTPARWKRRPDYEDRVTALRHEWAFGKTGAVIEGIYRSALKGNPFSQKLWLQYFHNFSEKQEVTITNRPRPQIPLNDIYALIDMLPKEQQEKHLTWLRELADELSLIRYRAQIDGDMEKWNTPPPADWKPQFYMVDRDESENEVFELPTPVTRAVSPLTFTDCCDPSALAQTVASGSSGVASL